MTSSYDFFNLQELSIVGPTLPKPDLASKMISLIERFERNPSLNVADSIAQGLSVPLWRLVKDAEDLRREKARAKKK